MVVCNIGFIQFQVDRMSRNNMRVSPSLDIMSSKPPRPPCWRDFVSNSLVAESVFTDISKIARSSNESFSSDSHSNIKSSKPKRLRARIHRTRSQFAIDESDLPLETLTVTLAETKPDEIGLCRETSVDEKILQEDNNRKCQTWLRNLEASKPLEDVNCHDLSEQDSEGISLEIPDDTLCYDESDTVSKRNAKCSKNKSSQTSDTCSNLAKMHTRAIRPAKRDLKRTSTIASGELINNG